MLRAAEPGTVVGLATSGVTHMAKHRRIAGALALSLVLAGCGLLDRDPAPEPAVEAFLDGWRDGSVDPETLTDPAAAGPANALLTAVGGELGGAPELELVDVTTTEQRGTEARVTVTWPLPSGPWSYDTLIPVTLDEDEDKGAWRVAWAPWLVHPQLRDDQTVDVRPLAPPRAAILDGSGQPLFEPLPIVTVGIEPGRVADLEQVLGVLAQTVEVDPGPLRDRVLQSEPQSFVEVITLRREDYEPVRPVLQPLPGVVFQEGERSLAPTSEFARTLLGRVGPPTAEVLDEAGPGFGPSTELGLSGLQRRFQQQLAGRPGVEVVALDAAGAPVATLHESSPGPGEPLRTTLVREAQVAADAALADLTTPAALVAVRASTGEVLAVAHGPEAAGNIAFTGQYPPGSSFKVVTTAALLAGGLTPETAVDCPATETVDGKEFRNAEGGALGATTFLDAFAQSCNTAFVQLSPTLPDEALAEAAQSFGFGGDWNPGAEAYTGQVPPPSSQTDRAASLIGQGRVLASPLLMASVAAAAADGTWRPPVLLPDHAQPGPGPVTLDPGAVDALRRLTREVVTSGTGSALAGVPGAPVSGKSGTAEFGEEVPPRTHAWFIGSQGDVAFAVLVEDGGGGGAVAGPLAARFLSALPLLPPAQPAPPASEAPAATEAPATPEAAATPATG